MEDDDDDSEAEGSAKSRGEKELKGAEYIISTPYFMALSLMLIMGNTLILALDKWSNTPETVKRLETYNKSFTYIFTVEMSFKIYALGLGGYLRDGYNIFDGILVIVSLFDVLMELVTGGSSGAGVLSVFRTLRLLRVFKLATKSKGLLILLTVPIIAFWFTSLGYHEYFERYCVLHITAGAVHIHLCVVGNGGLRLQM